MPMRHPTVQVPNIGPMDHAWDILGEWQAEFELPESESPVHGKVTFRSWGDAELQLDPIEAAIAGKTRSREVAGYVMIRAGRSFFREGRSIDWSVDEQRFGSERQKETRHTKRPESDAPAVMFGQETARRAAQDQA